VNGRAVGHLTLLRPQTGGFMGFVFVAGPLLGGWTGSPGAFAVLWLMGAVTSGSIFALNDLIDLPRDRANPARRHSPLVSGAVSPRAATVYAVVLPLVVMGAAARWPHGAVAGLAATLALGAVVNVYQKATRRPLAMDLLFATAMAAPLPVTALACLGGVPAAVWAGTCLFFLASLQLNSMAGNLKDLASDRVTGFRTVAVSLGATVGEDGKLVPGRAYARYCLALSAAVGLAGCAALALSAGPRPWALVSAAVVCAGACWVGARSVHDLLRGVRRPSSRGREAYFAAGFVMFAAAIGLGADPWRFGWAVTALLVWEGAFALLRRRRPRGSEARQGAAAG
jgi:4-hydroxybenzoate polyprenyltransferase